MWIATLFVVIASDRVSAKIQFDNFASIEGLSLVGDASISGRILRLTPARRNKTGAAWFQEKQAVRSGFETEFQFQLTHQDKFPGFHGTDGFAFVVQNSGPEAIGGRGSGAGFGAPDPTNPRHQSIPWMIAVFFDTLRNPQEGDPSSNYVAVRAASGVGGERWPTARLAFVPRLGVSLKDRRVHSARIVFDPPVLSVFLDDFSVPILKSVVDFSIATDHQGRAWVGFTAATGFGYQNHDILNWSFAGMSVTSSMAIVSSDITFPMSDCLPNRNLCTPERPFVEHNGDVYHIVLPANLKWGVNIPNPSGRPVAVKNAKGVVCWDLKAPASRSCGGPLGRGGNAGTGFLADDSPAGALITRTHEGRTWFSVNARDADFSENEGFYEFDLEIK